MFLKKGRNMPKPAVMAVMGSVSDESYVDRLSHILTTCDEDITFYRNIVSCHRDRKNGLWGKLLEDIEKFNITVVVACAGKAAALAGAIAAESDVIIIGVALPGDSSDPDDAKAAKLSITQLPAMKNPVLYAGFGETGIKKAANWIIKHWRLLKRNTPNPPFVG